MAALLPVLPSVLHALSALPWAGILYAVIIGVVVLVALFAGTDRREDAIRVLSLLLRRAEPPRRPLPRRAPQKRKEPPDKGGGPDQ
jgi:hypothetical protein